MLYHLLKSEQLKDCECLRDERDDEIMETLSSSSDQWRMSLYNVEDVALIVLYFGFMFTKDNSFFGYKKEDAFQLALFQEMRVSRFNIKWPHPILGLLLKSQELF